MRQWLVVLVVAVSCALACGDVSPESQTATSASGSGSVATGSATGSGQAASSSSGPTGGAGSGGTGETGTGGTDQTGTAAATSSSSGEIGGAGSGGDGGAGAAGASGGAGGTGGDATTSAGGGSSTSSGPTGGGSGGSGGGGCTPGGAMMINLPNGNVPAGTIGYTAASLEITLFNCAQVEFIDLVWKIVALNAAPNDHSLFCADMCMAPDDWVFQNPRLEESGVALMGPSQFMWDGTKASAVLTGPFVLKAGSTTLVDLKLDIPAPLAAPAAAGQQFALELIGLVKSQSKFFIFQVEGVFFTVTL